jgi:hypothetical protein
MSTGSDYKDFRVQRLHDALDKRLAGNPTIIIPIPKQKMGLCRWLIRIIKGGKDE